MTHRAAILKTGGLALVCITLLIAPRSDALGQDSTRVTGRVLDAETNEPLANVHVFYTGTTIGGVTDREGRFDLRPPPVQQIDLVISMLGYEIAYADIDLRIFKFKPLHIELGPVIFEMGGVRVVGEKPDQWRADLKRFERIIFGDTEFGHMCRIVNPQVLELAYKSRVPELTAHAVEPLVVINPDLGYRIEIHGLELRGRESYFTWSGQPVFEELIPADEKQSQRWQENRMAAYSGSMRHFLTALHHGTLKSEGFDAYHVSETGLFSAAVPIAESRDKNKRGRYPPVLSGNKEDPTRQLEFFGPLLITYSREPEPRNYLATRPELSGTRGRGYVMQSSWIELPFGTVTTDRRGNMMNDSVAEPIRFFGYWGWERMGEWLPADFKPTSL